MANLSKIGRVPFMTDEIAFIRQGLEKPGKTKGKLAEAMGIWPSALTNILNGTRRLKVDEATRAKAYLEVSQEKAVLSPVQKEVIKCVKITGEVAGGIWAEAKMGFVSESTDIPLDPRWPEEALYLLRVRGSSVNRRARDGDLVLCLDIFAAPRSAGPGDWVIMERERSGLIETTVKKVAEMNGRLVLKPDSDDPNFQTIFEIGEHDGEEVRVRAFVLRFVREATIF